jgi:hypothetical protein
MQLVDSRYFMFFLSPLYILSRMRRGFEKLPKEKQQEIVTSQHRIPPPAVNRLLEFTFSLESPIGHHLKFPWGASLLGVFRKI